METNKEWVESLNDNQLTQEEANKMMQDLFLELESAKPIQHKTKQQLEYEAIQAAKAFNDANNKTYQENPRQFNQQSYEENDKIAKDLMINFLTKRGHIITQSEETYGTDIITNKGKYEVEMSGKEFTNEESFPYPNVNFLGRKEKYGNDFYYVIISKNKTHALVAAASDIFQKDNKVVVYCNTNRNGYDEVYQLPKDRVKFFKL